MKRYVVTGSLGHISRQIVEGLVRAGKDVTVITSSADRVHEIKQLGATAAIGDVRDAAFVNNAFSGAEVVYTMIPPIWTTDNWRETLKNVGRNYAEAIRSNVVRHVVNLSSIGAHLPQGVGPVSGLYDFEQMLNAIPGLNVKHLRPSFFFYNFHSQIPLAQQGFIGGNYGDNNEKLFLTHTDDIAGAALEELLGADFRGSSVRYIIGDERSGSEIAAALGNAIGKDLKWVGFTDEQQLQGLLQAGLSRTHAENYTEMGKALRDGSMQSDARKYLPLFSKIKLEHYAQEFAGAFKQAANQAEPAVK